MENKKSRLCGILILALFFSLVSSRVPTRYNTNHAPVVSLQNDVSRSDEIKFSRTSLHKRDEYSDERERVVKLIKEGKKFLGESFHSKYTLTDELIGSGVYSFIFKGKMESGTEVAVKIIPRVRSHLITHQALDGELWEVKTMRKATDENVSIIKLIDSGEVDNLFYIM
jgi:hypothetical protein